MNWHGIKSIYKFEMARTRRTLFQSIVSPVISTSLYFVVFGAAIGSRITEIDGVSYGSFIVPGLIMLSLLTESISNASFGIYFPRFSGTIYELLSAPVSVVEIVIGYVGAAATKSIILGGIILATANLFVDIQILHPFWMLLFLCPDRHHFQSLRFHPGRVGRQLGKTRDRADADHYAADISWRQLLFDQYAASSVANGHVIQPRGLPDQRISLELLRERGCVRGTESDNDRRLSRRLYSCGLVDIQDRLSPAGLTPGALIAGS